MLKMFALGAMGALALAASPFGCVPQARYDDCVSDAAKARAQAGVAQKSDASRLQAIEQELAAAQATSQECEGKLSDLTTSSHNMQAQLDEATAINQQLRAELERLGKDVDKILTERGTLSKALDDAKSRLEELRKAQAAAEARATLFRDFARRFKPLEDAGEIRVETRRGQLVMQVQADLLFETGRTELRQAGKGILMEIAHALTTTSPASSGRRFLVTSAVDPSDVKTPLEGRGRRVRSTWELTAARSTAVVEYLISLGVSPAALTSAASGAFDPVTTGNAPADRARNRRVEIALLPSDSEIVAPPSAVSAPPPAPASSASASPAPGFVPASPAPR